MIPKSLYSILDTFSDQIPSNTDCAISSVTLSKKNMANCFTSDQNWSVEAGIGSFTVVSSHWPDQLWEEWLTFWITANSSGPETFWRNRLHMHFHLLSSVLSRTYLEMEITLSQDQISKYADKILLYTNTCMKELRRLFLVQDLVDSLKVWLAANLLNIFQLYVLTELYCVMYCLF